MRRDAGTRMQECYSRFWAFRESAAGLAASTLRLSQQMAGSDAQHGFVEIQITRRHAESRRARGRCER
jgi:hypothetical protein